MITQAFVGILVSPDIDTFMSSQRSDVGSSTIGRGLQRSAFSRQLKPWAKPLSLIAERFPRLLNADI